MILAPPARHINSIPQSCHFHYHVPTPPVIHGPNAVYINLICVPLFSHFDGVRSLTFHPVEPVLITASEDHTLKLWNLQKTVPAKKYDTH